MLNTYQIGQAVQEIWSAHTCDIWSPALTLKFKQDGRSLHPNVLSLKCITYFRSVSGGFMYLSMT